MSRALLLAGLYLCTHLSAEPLAPFTSDGCSLFPEGPPSQQQLWLNCCVEHDIAYWQGGTATQRHAADLALEQCVDAQGQPLIATLMRYGVRLGGSPYLPTSFRWGYGWDYFDYLPKTYAPLLPQEKALARLRLQQWLQRSPLPATSHQPR